MSNFLTFYFSYVSTKIKALICIKKGPKNSRQEFRTFFFKTKNKLHNNELQELDFLLSKLVASHQK